MYCRHKFYHSILFDWVIVQKDIQPVAWQLIRMSHNQGDLLHSSWWCHSLYSNQLFELDMVTYPVQPLSDSWILINIQLAISSFRANKTIIYHPVISHQIAEKECRVVVNAEDILQWSIYYFKFKGRIVFLKNYAACLLFF